MRSILCIAQVCCDILFGGLSHIPAPGEEVYATAFDIKAGGGANTAISLARLGAPTGLLTCIGNDLPGALLLQQLRQAGVQVLGKLQLPAYTTDISAVLSTARDRCFASFSVPGSELFDADTLADVIGAHDIVHTYPGYCGCYAIAELAEKHGKLLSLDMSACDAAQAQATLEALPHAHYLKLNEAEALALTGEKTAELALQRLAAVVKTGVVITLGENGCIGMDGREVDAPKRYAQPAIRYGAFCDACGAGDNFSAGFLRAIADGKALSQALTWGSHIAGQAVTWLGGNDIRINCTKIEC